MDSLCTLSGSGRIVIIVIVPNATIEVSNSCKSLVDHITFAHDISYSWINLGSLQFWIGFYFIVRICHSL